MTISDGGGRDRGEEGERGAEKEKKRCGEGKEERRA